MEIPAGWSFDHDDWVHEDCKVLAGPGKTELEGCSETSKQLGEADEHGVATFIYTILCHDCGAGIVVEREDLVMVDD